MQTQGSLQEANLASLLQTMQSERATGTLALENGSASCSLYFLFGHLFHASDASRQGEDVVVDALNWSDGNFHFDPRAKLPAEETIKSSPADLIAEAEKRGGPAPAAVAAPVTEAPAETPAGEAGWAAPAAEPASGFAAADSSWGTPPAIDPDTAPSPDDAAYQVGATSGNGWGTPSDTPAETTAETPAEPASTWSAPADATSSWATPAAETTSTWADQPVAETPPAEEAAAVEPAAEVAAPSYGSAWNTPVEAPAASSWETPAVADAATADATPEAPAAAWETPTVETPAEVAPTSAATAGVGEPPTTLYPLPTGKTTYEGLKSAFVDFPKLLRTLKTDGHTGYVHLQGEDFSGTLVFHAGQLIEALSDAAGSVAQGDRAFQAFRQQMDAGSGHLDVVDLSDDLVSAITQLFTAPQMFSGLLGRFVDFDALIDYLDEEKITGSVVVTNSSEIGVILLSAGSVLGAYTETARTPDTKLTAVSALAKERSAGIEVRSGATTVAGIDIEAQLAIPL